MIKERELFKFTTFPWHHWADARSKSSVALQQGETTLNWSELSSLVEIYQKRLRHSGFTAQDILMLPCNKSAVDLLLLLAVWQIGGQVLTINNKLSIIQRQEIIERYQIRFVWDDLPEASLTLLDLKLMLADIQLLETQIDSSHLAWSLNRYATITLTSGSSGFPKGVVHCFKQHLYSAMGLLDQIIFIERDSWLLSLPLFHVSGMAIIWRWLLRGARLQLVDLDWKDDLNLVTHASLVPTQLLQYLDYLDQQEQPFSQLENLLLGGAYIPNLLTQRAQRYKIQCWCGYGMTETASTVTLKKADASDTVGELLPYRTLEVIDNQIYIGGETLASGYFNGDTILSLTTQPNLLFPTKDSGFWVGNELMINGRLDQCFISGGENVYPEQVEKILLKHPMVKQVMVIGLPDERYGHRAVAFIRLNQVDQSTDRLTVPKTEPNQAIQNELKRFMKEHALPQEQPMSYFYLPQELLEGSLKLSRVALKKYFFTLTS